MPFGFSKNFKNDVNSNSAGIIPIVSFEQMGLFDTVTIQQIDTFLISNQQLEIGRFTQTLPAGAGVGIEQAQAFPLLLSISSVNQNIDIESKNFKTSSVTITFTNAEYNGKKLSDYLLPFEGAVNQSLINVKVSVFLKTPHTDIIINDEDRLTLSYFSDETYDKDRLCPVFFRGRIINYKHKNDTFTIEVEDSSNYDIHRDLPRTFLPDNDSMIDGYRNKLIPIVYGTVDKSPVMLDNSTGEIQGIFDSDFRSSLASDSVSEEGVFGYKPKVSLVKGNSILGITPDVEYGNMDYYNELESNVIVGEPQWKEEIKVDINQSAGTVDTKNVIAFKPNALSRDGFMQTKSIFKPSKVQYKAPISSGDWGYDVYGETSPVAGAQGGGFGMNEDHEQFENILTENDVKAYVDGNYNIISGNEEIHCYTNIVTENVASFIATSKTSLVIDTIKDVSAKEQKLINIAVNGFPISELSVAVLSDGNFDPDVQDIGDDITLKGAIDGEYNFTSVNGNDDGIGGTTPSYWYNLVAFGEDSEESHYNSDAPFQVVSSWYSGDGAPATSDPIVFFQHNAKGMRIHLCHRVKFTGILSGTFNHIFNSYFKTNISELDAQSFVDIESPFENKIYANIEGRTNGNPADIIKDILETELDFANSGLGYVMYDELDYKIAYNQNLFIKLGFSVFDKQINSKKLIQEISKNTLMNPAITSDGIFRFNCIKSRYWITPEGWNYVTPEERDRGTTDYEEARSINNFDVIKYSFDLTDISELYTKVEVHYNYDYAFNDYTKKTEEDFDNAGMANAFDKNSNVYENWLKYYPINNYDDHILKIESKYIRKSVSADRLSKYLFNYYKNQHLIVKLDLPIKYIDLEIGDLIKFTDLIEGQRAYGIDYTELSEKPDNQLVYPLFFVKSIKKSIDGVFIEAIQLHEIYDLEDNITLYEDIGEEDLIFDSNNQSRKFIFKELYNDAFNHGNIAPNLTSNLHYDIYFGLEKWLIQEVLGLESSAEHLQSYDDLWELPENPLTSPQKILTIQTHDPETDEIKVEFNIYATYNDSTGEYDYEITVPIDALENEQTMSLYQDITPISVTIEKPIPSNKVYRFDPPFPIRAYIPPQEEDVLLGDVNGDGVVNVLDVMASMSMILGTANGSNDRQMAGDINGDGILNILDVVALANIILEQD